MPTRLNSIVASRRRCVLGTRRAYPVEFETGAYRRGVYGVYKLYIPTKNSPSKLLWGRNDVTTDIEHEYWSFIPPPKNYTSQKQISGYAPLVLDRPCPRWLKLRTDFIRTPSPSVSSEMRHSGLANVHLGGNSKGRNQRGSVWEFSTSRRYACCARESASSFFPDRRRSRLETATVQLLSPIHTAATRLNSPVESRRRCVLGITLP